MDGSRVRSRRAAAGAFARAGRTLFAPGAAARALASRTRAASAATGAVCVSAAAGARRDRAETSAKKESAETEGDGEIRASPSNSSDQPRGAHHAILLRGGESRARCQDVSIRFRGREL